MYSIPLSEEAKIKLKEKENVLRTINSTLMELFIKRDPQCDIYIAVLDQALTFDKRRKHTEGQPFKNVIEEIKFEIGNVTNILNIPNYGPKNDLEKLKNRLMRDEKNYITKESVHNIMVGKGNLEYKKSGIDYFLDKLCAAENEGKHIYIGGHNAITKIYYYTLKRFIENIPPAQEDALVLILDGYINDEASSEYLLKDLLNNDDFIAKIRKIGFK